MPKITKTAIEKLLPGAADTYLWDDELKGFGVRCQPTGAKAFMVRYRTAEGAQRKLKIGRCTDLSPDKARNLARDVFARVASGQDPLAARREEKVAPTVADLEERYMREHARPFKKPASILVDEKCWARHILPAWRDKKIKAIDEADCLTLCGSLSHMPATANQVRALLSKAFNLAETWKWRPRNSNPVSAVKRHKIAEKEVILTFEQLAAISTAMDKMVEERRLTEPMAALVRLLMLTGCRKSEILLARRGWVDMSRKLLLLPDSKVGQRRIPLPDVALDIVRSLPVDSEWLIPGVQSDKPIVNVYRQWGAIKREAGVPDEVRLHDLRHSYASIGHMQGLSQKQIQIALGHKNMATTARYLHGATGDDAAVSGRMGNLISGAWAPRIAEAA